MPLVALTTYANGIGEEVFFRGALYAALPQRQAVVGLDRGSTPLPPRPPATPRWCWRPP